MCSPFLRTVWRRLESSPICHRLARGAFWSILAVIVSRGAGLFASIPIARILGKEGFGEYGIIYSTVVMFSSLVGSGLNMTSSKYVAEYRATNPGRAGRIIAQSNLFSIGISMSLACSLLAMSSWLATHALSAPHLAPLIALSSAALFFNILTQVQNGTLSGLEAFHSIADRNCWSGLVRFVSAVIGVWYWGLHGAVAAMILTEAVVLVLNELAIRRECRNYGIRVVFSRRLTDGPILFRFSIPAAMTGALMGPITWLCHAILVNRPNGMSEMGLYAAAIQWKSLILLIPFALNSVILPMLSNLFGSGDAETFKKVLLLNVAFYGISAGALALLISILSPIILDFYGDQFPAGSIVLVLVAFSSVFFAIQELLTRAMASQEAMWQSFSFQLASGVCLLGLTSLFTNRGWGAAGLAAASIIASFVGVAGQAWWLRRHYHAREGSRCM